MQDQLLALRKQTEEKLSQLDFRLRTEKEESTKKAKSLAEILEQRERDWTRLQQECGNLKEALRLEVPTLKRKVAVLEIQCSEYISEVCIKQNRRFGDAGLNSHCIKVGLLRVDAATSRTLLRRLLSEK